MTAFSPIQSADTFNYRMIRCKNALRGPYWVGYSKYESPLPAGWLPGDTFDQETQTLTRSKHPPIVGIVDLTNRTRQGFSSKGVPQYLFFPLDPAYPPMIVGSKAPTIANQFGIVRFESWDPNKTKWPFGALQELLGKVGDLETEKRALRVHIKPGGRPTKHDLVFLSLPCNPCGPLIHWDECFNIDPPGCKDVDDVISWRRLSDGTWEFGIHIANVAAWIPPDTPLDLEAKQKGQTVYENGTVLYPMFPPEISEERASLIADGQTRPVVSAIWQFTDLFSSPVSKQPRWEQTLLVVQNAFTYDTILEDSDKCLLIQQFLTQLTNTDVGKDPHYWIELAMITYNTAAAQKLLDIGQGILRKHAGERNSATALSELSAKTGCREISFLGIHAGEYCAVQPYYTSGSYSHAGLQKAAYCHASSPLRRYVDLVNQRILVGILNEDPASYKTVAQSMNFRNKQIKQFERSLWCLNTLKPSEISDAEGFVLSWKRREEEVVVQVFVPAWKRTVKLPFFLEKEEDTTVYGRTRDTSKSVVFQKADKIKLQAYCNLRKAQWSERFIFCYSDSSHIQNCSQPDSILDEQT